MAHDTFMDKIKSFFGLRVEPPKNDFRNPIWGSDDDDDGDELYSRHQMDIYRDPLDLHQEFTRHMQDMFRSFGSMFGDMRSFFNDDHFHSFPSVTEIPGNHPEGETENFDSNRIRDYYLKPGYHHKHDSPNQDIDLDGKISSNDISDLFRQKQDGHIMPSTPFNGNMVPGRSFCQTIITTSITKPDGTVETKRIVKNGNEVIEETITSTEPTQRGPSPSLDPIASTQIMLSQLSSLLKNFY
ncbi:HCLS1-associated protein X-1-like [Colias croceus]|uniref:HCLS1-associated protein X-1-like n=1 Tax=Colias crocea TaxID=72248 RepID=UPI001E27ED77|nr:HCLS1-associated protein X-1-like [Colias croceus]